VPLVKDQNALVDGFQRWQPAQLDAANAGKVVMPTAAELEAIHQQAHQEGFQSGYAEGYEAGRQQGDKIAVQEIERLKALLGTATEAMQELEVSVSNELVALAIEIARQMLCRALKVKPELVLSIVRAAMESLPQNTPHPHLCLHPDDAALVRAGMQGEATSGGWKIIEDPRMQRGGCRIETPVSEVNATIEHRWQRLAASFGQDSNWLDEQ
jgi:flagellar assembly protein FliH